MLLKINNLKFTINLKYFLVFTLTILFANIVSAQEIIEEVSEAISQWPIYAKNAGVAKQRIREIQEQHRRLI